MRRLQDSHTRTLNNRSNPIKDAARNVARNFVDGHYQESGLANIFGPRKKVSEGKDDSTYTMNDRKFKTKAFFNQADATTFIERNPSYGVLADADGVIHVAKNKSKEVK